MIDRSDEIIKQLNRIVNDRSISPPTRNKIREAVLHIRDLHTAVRQINGRHPEQQETKIDHVI